MDKTWPNFLVCPICAEDVPVNLMGNEYTGHKADYSLLTWERFLLAAEQNRMIVEE